MKLKTLFRNVLVYDDRNVPIIEINCNKSFVHTDGFVMPHLKVETHESSGDKIIIQMIRVVNASYVVVCEMIDVGDIKPSGINLNGFYLTTADVHIIRNELVNKYGHLYNLISKIIPSSNDLNDLWIHD